MARHLHCLPYLAFKKSVPSMWLSFMLIDTNGLTLQKYMGYCLIPTNKAQKMLLILSKASRGNPEWDWFFLPFWVTA